MSESCVAAIDQGTSSTRVLIISTTGEVLGSHQMEHKQHYPKAGLVEHDPLEIWKSVKTCLSGALSLVSSNMKVVSIGITNQRETTVVWNKNTGKPYHNAIVWNDTRTGPICDRLSKNGGVDRFREKTGLPIASYFSASKLLHLLETVPNLREDAEKGEALFGTIDTWIIWKLTNGAVHATDVSNASRTMFMNLKTLQWDESILEELNIPRSMLPAICPSSHIFGHVDTETKFAELDTDTTTGKLSHFAHFKDVPIAGVLGDQNAALFGQACFHAGDSKCTYGTGAFMLFNTGSEILQSQHGLLTTVAYQLGKGQSGRGGQDGAVYALEGSVAYSGSVVQWLRDNLGLIDSAQESEALARSVPNNGGVYFVPAFAGLFAPYWRGDARGVITGLTAFNTKAHIVRAALEASAFQTVEVSDAMQLDSHHRMPLTTLRVDGGMTANGLLMQFLSDLLNVPLVRPKVPETTALGAAFVAGLAVGLWKDTDELKRLWRADQTWTPSMTGAERHRLMGCWKKALHRSLDWVDSDHTPQENEEHHRGDAGGGAVGAGPSSAAAAAVASKNKSSGSGGSSGGGELRAATVPSPSTPLGTTGVPSTATTVGGDLLHSSLPLTRHLTTASVTVSAASAVAGAVSGSGGTSPADLPLPLRAVRNVQRAHLSSGQQMCVVLGFGVAAGIGFMAGVEAYRTVHPRK